MPFLKTISLPTGSLSIQINESEALFNQYIDFAARNNPKRGFLFVSKVLAKHYPCRPSQMRTSYDELVNKLLSIEDLSEKFIFVGMAETATALGLGVYETWLNRTQQQGIYCQTTRYFLDNQPFVDFEEAHSHATGFYLYFPKEKTVRDVFDTADTLVLIDDEISTGNTFANLINAYKKCNPYLKRVIVLSLLNLTSEQARHKVAVKTGIAVEWHSILSGQFEFTPNPAFNFYATSVESNQHCKKYLLNGNYGRLGINKNLPSLTGQLDELMKKFQPNAKILVLGTGEFIYHAYLIAIELERYQFKAYVQSTTRSPILMGDVIVSYVTFQDNYKDEINNYLYNAGMNNYDAIIVVYETLKTTELTHLIKLLNATSVKIIKGTVDFS
jgi:hypothetical protein